MKNSKLISWAILHSFGIFVYTSLVVILMTNGQKIFGNANNFSSGIVILMLFVLSAAIVGSLILVRPLMLYLDGFKKEAIKLLIYTIAVLLIITGLSMLIIALIK